MIKFSKNNFKLSDYVVKAVFGTHNSICLQSICMVRSELKQYFLVETHLKWRMSEVLRFQPIGSQLVLVSANQKQDQSEQNHYINVLTYVLI